MMRKSVLALPCLLLVAISYGQGKTKGTIPTTVPSPSSDSVKTKKTSDISEKVKSSQKSDGLFTVYQDTTSGSVQLYIRKSQLGKEFIYQSFSLSGPTSLFLNQSMHRSNFIFKVQKAFDKLEFSRVNTSFYYDPSNPVSKTKDVDKPEAIVLSERIVAEDADGYLINADGLFISEKMDPVRPASAPSFFSFPSFNLGSMNTAKSKYFTVRSFPQNTDFVVDLAYDNPNPYVSGGADITDARYIRVRMQHSFIALPENDYQPRYDDPRVGYFTQQVTDQTSISATPFRDVIHRWNLKKKNPNAALSEPVEPIVYWIENTTPVEYRDVIMEAGLKWNKAFEKAGFKNAIQMKIMPDDAGWDPADIRYNVIRWVSSANPPYGAIGPSFVNPKTGQILGADITIEWNFASGAPILDELLNTKKAAGISATELNDQNYTNCSLGTDLVSQMMTATTAMEAMGAGSKEMNEMHKQFLTWAVMHEMGHTLGLNHNMKASQMLTPAELNNTDITRKIGLVGSVMDYTAVNIAPDKQKQGDYYSTVAGPYDDWAIEYGYTPFNDGNEEQGLKNILSRSTDPKLAFGNDGDDMRAPGKGMDPRVNVWDLSSDAVGYAEERFKTVNRVMGKLLEKYSKPGQSYAELRSRYNALQSQRFNMIAAVSRYIGGVYVDRSFPDQHSAYKPFTPVPLSYQKKAMNTLSKYVFAPDAFKADAPVYAYLQPQRRGFSQAGSGDDYKVTAVVLNQQVNGVLAQILHPATLQRITNSRLYGNQYSVADVLTDLNKAIFAADLKTDVNVYRQYLQTEYVKSLLAIVSDSMNQYDDVAQSAALMAVKKIKAQLSGAVSASEETKAHRDGIIFLINQALNNK